MNLFPQNGYTAALYCRLSRDEDSSHESNSVTNQRRMLTEYAEKNGYLVASEYVDDGYSGTNYDRPGFKSMMEDAKDGKFNMILTKDLSRLGREYIATGQYIEQIFPRMGIRYIAINDGYDSLLDDSSADIMPIKNFFNEMHAKDTSKKCRAGRKSLAKAGKFGGSRAAFGFIKDPNDKHHLLIDPEAAEVVRLIFRLACEGNGYKAIARRLRERGIENPNAYINRVDPTYFSSNYWRQPHDWHPSSIKTILHNETYLGKIVSGKRKVKSFKCKEIVKTPPEEWIIVDDMHEAIIDQRTWDLAHENLTKRKRCDNHGAIQMFAGLLKCADCGYSMAYRQNPRKSYVCSLNNVKGKDYCSSHYITYEALVDIVIHDIREKARRIVTLGEHMADMIEDDCKRMFRKKTAAVDKEMQKLEARATELETILDNLYEDKALGRITAERFQKLSAKYETEQTEAKSKAAQMQKSLDEFKQCASDIAYFSEVISKYTHLEFLNSAILNELVERIEIGAGETVNGVKKQNVHIFYKQYSYYTFDAFDKENSFAPQHPDKEKIAAQEASLFTEESARWADNEEQAI